MKTIDVYSLAPICHRCNVVESKLRILEEEGMVKVTFHSTFQSIWYLLKTGHRPPVLVSSQKVLLAGRDIQLEELRSLLGDDKFVP